jgi:hypothetical protein
MIRSLIKVNIMICGMLAAAIFASGDTYEEDPVRAYEPKQSLSLQAHKYSILEKLYVFNKRSDLEAEKAINNLMRELVQINAYIHRPECVEDKEHI